MKKRIATLSALLRNHSKRARVPERCEVAERLARFSTCKPWPMVKRPQRCQLSGNERTNVETGMTWEMCMEKYLRSRTWRDISLASAPLQRITTLDVSYLKN